MKKFAVAFISLACSISDLPAQWTSEGRQKESEQVAKWEAKLIELQGLSSEVRTVKLRQGLRAMGYWKSYDGHCPSVDLTYQKIQYSLISSPGHAQRIADEVEDHRERVQNVPRANQTDYDFFRALSISQTLIHMPSPETIKVLGNYLYDERDTPPKRTWTPENAHLAAYALSRIGLRDFPFEGPMVPNSLTIWSDIKQLPDYRVWWEEIKSGQRAFSFKGQAVEYRFKPDGTWETIPISNPPDDGPKPALEKTIERPNNQPTQAKLDSPEASRDHYWWWLGIGGLVLLAAGACICRRNHAG